MHMPPLSIFGARSFYFLLAAVICLIAQALGYDLGAPEDIAETLFEIASGIFVLLSYRERMAPGRRLVVKGPLT